MNVARSTIAPKAAWSLSKAARVGGDRVLDQRHAMLCGADERAFGFLELLHRADTAAMWSPEQRGDSRHFAKSTEGARTWAGGALWLLLVGRKDQRPFFGLR